MDIITLQEYKTFKGLTRPDGDAKLSMIISAVSNLIQTYTGLTFSDGVTPITETFSFDYQTDTIYLSVYPVQSVSNVTVVGGGYPYDSTVHFPYDLTVDYTLVDGKLIARPTVTNWYSNYWPITPSYIQVTYLGGTVLTAGSSPFSSDIKLAAIELVSYYANDEYIQQRNIAGTSITGYSSKDPVLPPHVVAILDLYKNTV